MVQKKTGIYSHDANPDSDEPGQLYVEISSTRFACLSRGAVSGQIEAFEIFDFDTTVSDWAALFAALQKESRIINGQYQKTNCYFNVEEALVIPESKFSEAAAEAFLSFTYGESDQYLYKFDKILAGTEMVIAYRLHKSMMEELDQVFQGYRYIHRYTLTLEDIFTRSVLDEQFLKLIVYKDHFIVAIVVNGGLQLVQSVHYQKEIDILYHLINLLKQFTLETQVTHLEVSGLYDPGSHLHQQVVKLFGRVSFESIQPTGAFVSIWANHPAHYYTPYHKLAI